MRILDLNDAGIKLISSTKKQVYLSMDDIKDFLDKKYKIRDNVLNICNKELRLSNTDIEQFEETFDYIKNHFERKQYGKKENRNI